MKNQTIFMHFAALKLILASMVFLLSGCTESPQKPLRIGSNPWPGHEPLYLARDLGLQLGAGYADFDADVDVLSYDSPEVFVGATYQAWQGGTMFARLGYRNYDYDEPVTFFPGLSETNRTSFNQTNFPDSTIDLNVSDKASILSLT